MKNILGIDDGGFIPNFKYLKSKSISIPLFAVYCYYTKIIDIKYRNIKIDGLDATKKLLEIIKTKRPDLILSSGVTFAGFNMIDFIKVYEKEKIPILIIIDRLPNFSEIKEALIKHFKDYKKRLEILNKLPPIQFIENLYVECIGINNEDAKRIIRELRIFSKIPEPLRLAHIVARAYYEYKFKR